MTDRDWAAEAASRAAWIRGRVDAAGARGAVVGMSGGVDSAAVAFLVHRAFACPDGLAFVCMPSDGAQIDVGSAALLMGAAFHREPLPGEIAATCPGVTGLRASQVEAIHRRVLEMLGALAGYGFALPVDERQRTAEGNALARLRMLSLYYVANALGLLVVGTTNRVEHEIGYFTKWGDGAADMEPIADLDKGDVRELARHLGVPARIVEAAPTAGLWEGQTDEAEIGVAYGQLDFLVNTSGGPDSAPRDWPGGQAAYEAAQRRVLELHARTEHKRRVPYAYPDASGMPAAWRTEGLPGPGGG